MEEKNIHSVIIPGSYDPVTLGHLDIIRRAASEYEEVYAVIFVNPEKQYTFSLDDRIRMLLLATDDIDNVMVSYSNGLVIDYMREHDIDLIIKGYRNNADLEYEKKQAAWNLKMGGYNTLLWESDPRLKNTSSTLARELIKSGDSTLDVLPKSVAEYINSKHEQPFDR